MTIKNHQFCVASDIMQIILNIIKAATIEVIDLDYPVGIKQTTSPPIIFIPRTA